MDGTPVDSHNPGISAENPQKKQLQQVTKLYELGKYSSQQLLERLWSEEWLDILEESENSNITKKKKSYKVIGEKQVII